MTVVIMGDQRFTPFLGRAQSGQAGHSRERELGAGNNEIWLGWMEEAIEVFRENHHTKFTSMMYPMQHLAFHLI